MFEQNLGERNSKDNMMVRYRIFHTVWLEMTSYSKNCV